MVSALLEKLRRIEASDARMIYAWELPSIMRKHIVTGAMGTVYFAIISGMFLVAFGGSIGMEDWQWSLISAGTSLALLFQLASAHVVGRTGNRRHFWFVTSLTGRMVRGAAIATAFYLSCVTPGGARTAFILMLVIASVFDAICSPPWMSWLADIIPEEQHGHFWGRRGAWISLANVCIVVPLGFLVDRTPTGWTQEVLLLVFALALVLGFTDLFIHRTIPVPPMELAPRHHFWQGVAAPFRDPRFRPWLTYNAAWTFSMTLGGAVAVVFFVRNLGISRNLFGGSIVLIMLPLLGTALTGKRIGLMVDRYGVKKTLGWGSRLWAILPAFWLIATPGTALLCLGAAACIGGLGSTMALNASNKLTTRLPDREHVAMYVAVSTCVASLAGASGSALAGLVLYFTRGMTWQVAGVTVVGFHFLFAASFVLRNLCVWLVRRIPEPTAPADPA